VTRRDGRRVPAEVEHVDTATQPKWLANNLRISIARRQRRLSNSMAHTPHPRPADLARWRMMQAEIEQMQAARAALRAERKPREA
jgi:hypothetical protein